MLVTTFAECLNEGVYSGLGSLARLLPVSPKCPFPYRLTRPITSPW